MGSKAISFYLFTSNVKICGIKLGKFNLMLDATGKRRGKWVGIEKEVNIQAM